MGGFKEASLHRWFDDRQGNREEEAELTRLKAKRLEREASRTSSHKTITANLEFGKDRESWEDKEAQFNLEQALRKAQVKVKEGRGDAVDILAMNTFRKAVLVTLGQVADLDAETEGGIPCFLGDPLLHVPNSHPPSIRHLLELEHKNHERHAYWQSILDLQSCDLREQAIFAEFDNILKDLTLKQLETLHDELLKKPLIDLVAGMDADFRAQLTQYVWREIRKRRINFLNAMFIAQIQAEYPPEALFTFTEMPAPRSHKKLESRAAKDLTIREPSSRQSNNSNDPDGSLQAYLAEMRRPIVGADEVPFNLEAEDVLQSTLKTSSSSLKTPPLSPDLLKPRFFNRARLAFEWNKYNQTHFDAANPPPKTIQGFRFNIFYPSLLNTPYTPQYHIEPDPKSAPNVAGGGGTVLLWFRVSNSLDSDKISPATVNHREPSSSLHQRREEGPYYRDLCFRIPDCEWEIGARRGFRCIFDRFGTLRLHFWFRKAHSSSAGGILNM